MTKAEFGQLADAIRTYYPREKILPNPEAMSLWYDGLKDIEYKVASAALQKWVATNRWSPAISDLRELVSDLVNPAPQSWGEAWENAQRAVRRYGYYQEAEALGSLDDLTRTCVKRIGFRDLCKSENISNERANFRMIYEQEMDQRKRRSQLPERLKELETSIKLLEGG